MTIANNGYNFKSSVLCKCKKITKPCYNPHSATNYSFGGEITVIFIILLSKQLVPAEGGEYELGAVASSWQEGRPIPALQATGNPASFNMVEDGHFCRGIIQLMEEQSQSH